MSWSRRLSRRAVRHRIAAIVLAGAVALAPATAQTRGRCRIEGSVLDQNGEPVPAAAITAFDGDRAIARTTSDAEGTFRFGHMPRAPVLVEATGPGSERVPAFSPDGIALLDRPPRTARPNPSSGRSATCRRRSRSAAPR